MTTIARVAQEAGVGVGTVSRVINGSASVSEATRRRVLDVVAELGYEPNATARALSTGRTRSVGVIAPFFTRPSVIERLRGVAPLLAGLRLPAVLFDVERPEQRDGRLPLADRPRRRPALDLARARRTADLRAARRRRHPGRARRPGARRGCRPSPSTTSRAAGWPPSTCSSSGTGGSRSPATRSTSVHGASASSPPLHRLPARARRRRRARAPRARQAAPARPRGAPRSRATCSRSPSPPTAIFAASDLQALADARRARRASACGCRTIFRWSGSTTSSWPATRA